MKIFVTVGSTSFDPLIQALCSEECINFLASNGFKEIVFQIGRGTVIPEESSKLQIQWFRFKESLTENIRTSSLVIGHAGAGTILESLFECKPLVVVLNDELMDNHQGELAEKLAAQDLLKYTTCSSLLNILRNYKLDNFSKKVIIPQQDSFIDILHQILCLK